MIDHFYELLKNLKSFSPNKETNELFTNLCKYSLQKKGKIVIDEKVLEINKYCSIGEYEMEKFYANKIINSINPQDELLLFLYYQNYFDLTKIEYLNASFFCEVKNVLFIGGGPLPLTSIILAKNYNIKSKIIDIDITSINIGKKLITVLGLEDLITFELSDATYHKDNFNYDICYIASLVFLNKDHEKILLNISRLNFNLLLTRSSHGYRQLLYRKVDEKVIKKYFNIQFIIHPKNEIINSIILSTKK